MNLVSMLINHDEIKGFLENQDQGSRIEDRGSGIEDRGSRIEDQRSRIDDRMKKKAIKSQKFVTGLHESCCCYCSGSFILFARFVSSL